MVVSVCSMKKSGKSPADISFSKSPVKFSGWCSVIMQRVTDIFFIHLRTFVPSYLYELRVKLLTSMPFRVSSLTSSKESVYFRNGLSFENSKCPYEFRQFHRKVRGSAPSFFPFSPQQRMSPLGERADGVKNCTDRRVISPGRR